LNDPMPEIKDAERGEQDQTEKGEQLVAPLHSR
jgi:hypothetical protein